MINTNFFQVADKYTSCETILVVWLALSLIAIAVVPLWVTCADAVRKRWWQFKARREAEQVEDTTL